MATIAASWPVRGDMLRVGALVVLALAELAAFTLYDLLALGLPIAREEPARFDAYHFVRTGFAMVASALLVTALVRARAPDCLLDRVPVGNPSVVVAMGAILLGSAATALFVIDPSAFHAGAQEDRPLEWLTAGLLLAAGGLIAHSAMRRAFAAGRRSILSLLLSVGLVLLLLVMAMEEISWGQRLFGFATPEAVAAVNWQGEFNFHNIHTDLFESAFYTGSFALLILLPFLRDLVPAAVAGHRLAELAPRRGVALVAAPFAWFNYGNWNLVEMQLATLLSLFVLIAYARAAARRGDRAEKAAFALAAIGVAVGQALFLLHGPAMVDLPDATEYKELFIALGLAWYAVGLFAAARFPVSDVATVSPAPPRHRTG